MTEDVQNGESQNPKDPFIVRVIPDIHDPSLGIVFDLRPHGRHISLTARDAHTNAGSVSGESTIWEKGNRDITVPLYSIIDTEKHAELLRIVDACTDEFTPRRFHEVISQFGKPEQAIPKDFTDDVASVKRYIQEVADRLYIPKSMRSTVGIREDQRESLKIPLAAMLVQSLVDRWVGEDDLLHPKNGPVVQQADLHTLAQTSLEPTPVTQRNREGLNRALLELLSLGVTPQEKVVGELKALITESITEGEDPAAFSLHFMEVRRDQPEAKTYFGKQSNIQSDFLFRIYKRRFISQVDSGYWGFSDVDEHGVPRPAAEFSTRIFAGDAPKSALRKAVQKLDLEEHIETIFSMGKRLKEEAEKKEYALPKLAQFPMRYIV